MSTQTPVSFVACRRGATAVTYVTVLGLVALTGSIAFAQFGDNVKTAVTDEAKAAASASGEDTDSPSGSLALEVAGAGAEVAVVEGPWALAKKGASKGFASARKKLRGRAKLAYDDRSDRPRSPDGRDDTPPDGRPRSDAAETRSPGGRCRDGVCKDAKVGCFVAGTPVLTASGPKPIEQIEVGDLVVSRDEVTGEAAVKPVVGTTVRPDMPLVRIGIAREDGVRTDVRSTLGHPYWTLAREWVRADGLVPGDVLLDAGDRELRVVDVEHVSESATVYNVEVEETHTYFVGELAAWVHNAPKFPLATTKWSADDFRAFIDKYERKRLACGALPADVAYSHRRIRELTNKAMAASHNRNGIE